MNSSRSSCSCRSARLQSWVCDAEKKVGMEAAHHDVHFRQNIRRGKASTADTRTTHCSLSTPRTYIRQNQTRKRVLLVFFVTDFSAQPLIPNTLILTSSADVPHRDHHRSSTPSSSNCSFLIRLFPTTFFPSFFFHLHFSYSTWVHVKGFVSGLFPSFFAYFFL